MNEHGRQPDYVTREELRREIRDLKDDLEDVRGMVKKLPTTWQVYAIVLGAILVNKVAPLTDVAKAATGLLQ